MKKAGPFLLFLSIIFNYSQAQYELIELKTPKSGNTSVISQTFDPPESTKAIEYDSLNMNYVGGWSLGQSFCIASSPSGDTVFVGSGAGVLVFDATDPYNLVKLCEVHARALVDAIQYVPSNKRLYLSAYFSGLEVWDLTDFQNPVMMGRAQTTGLPRGGVYVPPVDNMPGQIPHAFMVTVADGIDVFEIDNWGQPTFLSNQNFTGSMLIWYSSGQGDTLFLSASNGGTKAIGLTSASLTNLFTVPGYSTSVAALDNLIYVIDYNSGLKIHDISSIPSSVVGDLALPGFPYRLGVYEDYVHVANSTTNPGGGVNIVNTTDPENPELIGEYPEGQTFLCGNSSKSISTGSMDGIVALDLADPTNPVFASNIEIPSWTADVAVKNDLAYMGNNGFRVFDVSDKSNPVQIGFEETDGALVKVFGDYAVYCPRSMGSGNKINIMDVSDPTAPVKLAYKSPPAMTYDLDIKGYTAYVACWWDGIRVVDYSDPESPAWGSHVMGWTNGATPGEEWMYCQALDVSGDYLYAVDYGPFEDEDTRGLYVFDISDPTDPVLVKRYVAYEGKAYDIEVSEGYAYITDSEGGLSIVSVENPLSPIQVFYLPMNDAAQGIDVFGSYAFVANYILEGVQVIDISDPLAPEVAGFYKRSACFALNVTYDAGHVYVCDGPGGMQIYNYDLLNNINEPPVVICYGPTIYPNPAKDILHIGLDGESQIELFNLGGQMVLSKSHDSSGHSTIDLNIEELPRGIYLISTTVNGVRNTEKIILQ